MDCPLLNRYLWRLSLAMLVFVGAQKVQAHAGHDAIPEAATQAVGDVAPRFYSRSEALDAVLVFPKAGETGDPILYLTTSGENLPVPGAAVVVEVLLPDSRKLDTTTGTEPGTYIVQNLTADTTHTLSAEVDTGELFDILTFDNVIVEPPIEVADSGATFPGAPSAIPWGLPAYLFYALLAVVGIVLLANLLVVIIWLTRLARGRRNSPGTSTGDSATLGLLLLLMMSSLANVAFSHAGDDHSGASLGSSGDPVAGASHFVAIQTQFQAGIRTTLTAETVLPKSLKALGQIAIRSDMEADVTPPAEGRLKPPPTGNGRIPIAGTTVTKGQTLVVLEQLIPASDKATLSSERAQVESELAQARRELELASRDASRADSLQNVISRQEADETRAKFTIAQDKVRGLTARLASLTSSLEGEGSTVRDIPIMAPISGIIAESRATLGEYVSPEKILFTIIDLDQVFVDADIFESDISNVREATSATVTLEAYPNQSFEGNLQTLGQKVNPESRTLLGRFSVDNPSHLLRGGMFATVAIHTGGTSAVLVIPKAALFTQDGVKQVFKKVAPETYVATPVVVSDFRNDMAVIGYGLAAGDRVAVSGLYQIRMSPVIGTGL